MERIELGAKWERWSLGLFAVMLVLFAGALAQWLGFLGGEDAFRPRAGVLLTGGMVLQPLASLLARRSRVAFYLLLALSVTLLGLALASTS